MSSPVKTSAILPAMSYWKFIFLCMITLGMYQVYWLWRLWEIERLSRKETYRFRSSLRAVLAEFTNFILFSRLQELVIKKKYVPRVNVTLLAALYLIAGFAGFISPTASKRQVMVFYLQPLSHPYYSFRLLRCRISMSQVLKGNSYRLQKTGG